MGPNQRHVFHWRSLPRCIKIRCPAWSLGSRAGRPLYYDYEITRMRFRRRCCAVCAFDQKKKNTRTRPRVMAPAKPAQLLSWLIRPPETRFWYWSANQQLPVPSVLCCRTPRVSRITALCKYSTGLRGRSLFYKRVYGEWHRFAAPRIRF